MPDELVCVTGATGFIAAQIVRELLAQGYQVRGTVRDRARAEAALADAKLPNRGSLELVEADLLVPGSFDAAVAGARYVMHAASPYRVDVKDPQKDLVDPALNGTLEVLGAAQRAGVKRVVLTSSVAAMSDEPDATKKLSEADWNTQSSLTRNPYYYSKVLAERAAWDFVEKEKPGFSLVVINPFMVIGPSLTSGLNQSNELVRNMLIGKGFPGIVDLAWGLVDVRDVALGHVLAMMTPKARGRYLCAAQTLHMRDVVKVFRAAKIDQRYPVSKRDLSGWFGSLLVRLGSYTQPRGTGSFLRTHIRRRPEFDNRKIKRDLGLTFRAIDRTLIDTALDLERWGHLDGQAKSGAPELVELLATLKASTDALRKSDVVAKTARTSGENKVLAGGATMPSLDAKSGADGLQDAVTQREL